MKKNGIHACCRHCGAYGWIVARRLCRACYHSDDIRTKYPSSLEKGHHPLPATPTDALPGTPRKIIAMIERASRGEVCFHPGDR